jgi:hypothetical protein
VSQCIQQDSTLYDTALPACRAHFAVEQASYAAARMCTAVLGAAISSTNNSLKYYHHEWLTSTEPTVKTDQYDFAIWDPILPQAAPGKQLITCF